MDKKTYFIIVAVIIVIVLIIGCKYANKVDSKEHMINTSTCPCDVNTKEKKQIGDCKCSGKSDMVKSEHGCPADRTYGIIPPLLVEPRMILTDNSMRCHELNNNIDAPSGYMDDEISKYDDNLVHVKRLYGDDDGSKFYADNSYSMLTMKTGLPPLTSRNMDTCLTNKVIKKCGNKLMK